jgi:predicted HTH transcriptional regulator
MTSSTDTRNEAFAHVPDIKTRRGEVLFIIETFGPISDKDIARRLDHTINTITPRRGELVRDGLVRQAGTVKDPDTNVEVATWERA